MYALRIFVFEVKDMANLTVSNKTAVDTITQINIKSNGGNRPCNIKPNARSEPISLPPGSYEVEVELTDPNGNKRTVKKDITISSDKNVDLSIHVSDSEEKTVVPPTLIK